MGFVGCCRPHDGGPLSRYAAPVERGRRHERTWALRWAGGAPARSCWVEAAVDVAVRAPSIHNTQPWRWVFDGEALTLLADRSRQLPVADSSGHSLLISCGAAAVLTELGLRAGGWRVESTLFPDPKDKDVLARYRTVGREEPDQAVQAQVEAALRRQSDRRPFSPEDVSDEEVEQLRDATRPTASTPTSQLSRISGSTWRWPSVGPILRGTA